MKKRKTWHDQGNVISEMQQLLQTETSYVKSSDRRIKSMRSWTSCHPSCSSYHFLLWSWDPRQHQRPSRDLEELEWRTAAPRFPGPIDGGQEIVALGCLAEGGSSQFKFRFFSPFSRSLLWIFFPYLSMDIRQEAIFFHRESAFAQEEGVGIGTTQSAQCNKSWNVALGKICCWWSLLLLAEKQDATSRHLSGGGEARSCGNELLLCTCWGARAS